jgi:hypothetical protein
MKTKLIHYLFSVYFVSQPLHVSGVFSPQNSDLRCFLVACHIYFVLKLCSDLQMSGFDVFLVWWRPELLTVYFAVRLERLSGPPCVISSLYGAGGRWGGVIFPWRLSNRILKLSATSLYFRDWGCVELHLQCLMLLHSVVVH